MNLNPSIEEAVYVSLEGESEMQERELPKISRERGTEDAEITELCGSDSDLIVLNLIGNFLYHH